MALLTRRLTPIATALAVMVLSAQAGIHPAPASATDSPGNIPGVPLPSSTVSGKLGGPVYDVVYRIDVPAGHVLQASMTGTTGTDFDLYLFDSTATDIYAEPPVGQVASSTGPTSTESITYPSVGGGTYYLDLSGASKVEGTYTLAVRISSDTNPPRIALTLDGGAPATNDPNLSVTIIASDALSGIDSLQLSGDGVNWQPWQPYVSTLSWEMAGADGLRTLWARARDRAGNISAPVSASITIDTTPPTVTGRAPAPGGTVAGLRPTFRVQFSEPIAAPTWYNAGFILQSADGQSVYGTLGYDDATRTGSFTPRDPLVAGAAYVVSLGRITDLAGNPLPPLGSWTVTPLMAPALTLTATSSVLSAPADDSLAGRIDLWPGGPLELQASVAGGPWVVIQPIIPGADGSWTSSVAVEANTSFRVHYGGSQFAAETYSSTFRVLVRRSVTLLDGTAGVVRRVPAFSRQHLTASVSPSAPAVNVTLAIYRYVSGRGYILQSSVTRKTIAGRYTFSWTPGRASYYVRMTAASTPLYANGLSPTYRWVGY